ncbi:hypothetical protein CA54_30770 [Symmachiella macrocystis]|uniref:Curli production assembly/transport component CsgG n=1 Tax=Symmachiella macrocystis TaxID=2527985 RepID=A0A5C6BU36_9PLAN|nr:hypothetical protein [Symmachiella macrocystis]TWU14234.1 hypothetical protein CA54_30770 [Symmachiella macrocystis]
MRCLLALTVCLLFSGCIVLQPRAENPFPNMNTIAVVPFFNQSAMPGEINDLGRTFGLAYASELQKIHGYDVLPLGTVETAILENRLQFRNENDVLELARLLEVDAVVIGTITAFDPWYPPKIGLKVNWYSTKNWTMFPDGEPCGPCEDDELDENGDCPCHYNFPKLRTKDNNSIIRGQNAASVLADSNQALPLFGYETNSPATTSLGTSRANRPLTASPTPAQTGQYPPVARRRFPAPNLKLLSAAPPVSSSPIQLLHPVAQIPLGEDPAQYGPIVRQTPQVVALANQAPLAATPVLQAKGDFAVTPPPPLPSPMPEKQQLPRLTAPPPSTEEIILEPVPMPPELLPTPGMFVEVEQDHTKPVMSYTRMFDGKDEAVVALLRDYVEITGDKRSGGWEGYMQRTDDYITFCCHIMIIDTLTLHGGGLATKVWLKIRKDR